MAMKNIQSPNLRFPEFANEWVISNVGEEASVTTGSRDTQNRREDGKYPFFVRSNKIERINSWELDCEAVLTSGDGVGVGKNVHYVNGKFDFHQRVYAIYRFSCNLNGKYFYQYFKERFFKRVMRLSAKNSVDSVRMSMITDMTICLPSIPEQNKIADFLSSVDLKIDLLERKKQLLDSYKIGCMQKLFSQEVRFKTDKGQDFPQSKMGTFGSVVSIYDGTHQTPQYVEEGIPFYSVEQVTANNYVDTKFVTKDAYDKEHGRIFIEKDDILMTRIGDIGTCRLIDWDVKAAFYVSLALLKVKKGAYPSFVNQFIKSDFFQRELWMRTIHAAFPKKINLGEIEHCRFRIPHLDEQRKIGDFLSAIDQKRELVAIELEKAKAFKKGLLQQMFV